MRKTIIGVAAATAVVALGAGFQARAERRIASKVLAYLQGGFETDHVKSVEIRGFGEGGAELGHVLLGDAIDIGHEGGAPGLGGFAGLGVGGVGRR